MKGVGRATRRHRLVREGGGLAAGLVGVLGLALSGCAAPHTGLGPSASSCFQALPSAEAAVHGQGHLVGLKRWPAIRVLSLASHIRGAGGIDLGGLPGTAGDPSRLLCVVAFQGPFGPGQVENAQTDQGGPFALVVLTPDGEGGVRSFVVRRLPLRFRHLI